MDDKIAIYTPKDIAETTALSKTLSVSSLLPMALRKKPEDILAVLLTGAELGLAPMQALRAIHVIEGKPTLSAGLMVALVRRSGLCEYFTLVESNAKVATYKTKRRGCDEVTMSFTIEEARAAGLLTKGNWQKYPAAMLRSRCASGLCGAEYQDVLVGIHTPEELETDVTPAASTTDAPVQAQVEHVEQVKQDLRKQLKREPVEDAVIVEAENNPATSLGISKDEALKMIAAAATAADLKAIGPRVITVPEADRAEVRAAFLARRSAVTV